VCFSSAVEILASDTKAAELQVQINHLNDLITQQALSYKEEMQACLNASNEQQAARFEDHEKKFTDSHNKWKEITEQMNLMAKTSVDLSPAARKQLDTAFAVVEHLQKSTQNVEKTIDQCKASIAMAQNKSDELKQQYTDGMTNIQSETEAMKEKISELSDNMEDMRRKGCLTEDMERKIQTIKDQLQHKVTQHEQDHGRTHKENGATNNIVGNSRHSRRTMNRVPYVGNN
jgi:chromosome segregation ATPase